MIELGKNHDPSRNAQLLEELLNNPLTPSETLSETEAFFDEIKIEPSVSKMPQPASLAERALSFYRMDHSIPDPHNYKWATNGTDLYPEWKTELDNEYEKLEQTITRHVNVEDFGAVGDGKTDCTAAFKKAIGNGRVQVYVPPGEYIVKFIELPSWTRLVGAGKGATILKLHADAPKRRRLITNSNYLKGNRNIAVENLSMDWNVHRLESLEKTGFGGNFSSCLVFAQVKYGWVKNVEGINPGLHCFDITSPLYNYSGDGYRARGGCQYIWLDQVSGYGFGDDGVTTHHSDYIFVSNSYFHDPSGSAHDAGVANSNGLEIDDGSRHVWLVNNATARCFGGVEIKAHGSSSAASSVYISGHISLNDNRAFNFRHIGHHKITDPESRSAFNITAERLVAIAPVFSNLYWASTPRALVVSGYRNVAINRFLFAGDPEYDYKGNPAATIQYRAKHVSLTNGVVKGFKTSNADILISGGEQGANHVRVKNIESIDSSGEAVKVGEECIEVFVEGVNQK
ncbi:glycosyl hydrolase family 28-related protein [Planococcus sp. YIM B11945]|uniref:glycosyl hydrolase family 28-related protein n=1 Tax=Planococcus sp. YIM B11945 TaxID=3435410 RepID=UPI003D7D367F